MASPVPICSVCEIQKRSTIADVWCSECDEGLCKDCSQHHAAAKMSRSHSTTAIAEYSLLPEYVKSVKPFCKQHNENFHLFCRDHLSPCCRSCMLEGHRNCKIIDKIEQVTGNVKSSTAFTEIEDTLSEIAKNVELLMKDRLNNLDLIRKERQSIENNIMEMRKRINKHLDKIQANTIKDLDHAEEKECTKIQSVLQSLSEKQEVLSECQENLLAIKNHGSDIQAFLAIGDMEKTIGDIILHMEELLTNVYQSSLEFDNEDFYMDYFSMEAFGNINLEHKDCTVKLVDRKGKEAQLNMAIPLAVPIDTIALRLNKAVDTHGKGVRGCVVMHSCRMAFSCNIKEAIYVHDVNAKYQFKKKVRSAFDITFSEATNTIYVSTGLEGQAFVKINCNHRSTKSISSDTCNHGVVVRGNFLIYCAAVNKGICETDLTDGSFRVIVSVNLPGNCYVTEYQDKIYYTNNGKDTVTCCSMDGTQVWQFTDNVLKYPQGIDIDNNGNVYVVGKTTSNVVVISPDGKRYKEMLSSRDGLSYPCALHYNRSTNQLLVATIKVKHFCLTL